MNRKRVDGIRHVTSEESNIFSELGFDDADAEQLRGQAEKEVEQLMALKRQLMQEIAEWIDEHQLKQADAAAKLSISRPRISDVVNQKTCKFTLDALVMMLMKLGKPVRLQIG
ncbi:XRE family transcriptional regulator [Klebsiella variicola]|nr:XRE family transcriptional regulator [Klebsiella variicola]ELA2406163.1 XRE family transcriptional regulator [Klebsiella variicola]